MSELWSDPVHIWIAVLVLAGSVTLGTLVVILVGVLLSRSGMKAVRRLLGNFLDLQSQRDKEADVAKVVFMEQMKRDNDSFDRTLGEVSKRLDTHSSDLKTIHAQIHDLRVEVSAHMKNHPR